jgi:dolichol kinase
MRATLFIEFKRKALHLIALIIPFGLYYFPANLVAILLFSVTLVMVIVEILRLRFECVQRLFIKFFSPLLREHEQRAFTGSTFLLISASACTLLLMDFRGEMALSLNARTAFFYSFTFLILGDATAAIFGKLYGKKKIVGPKTYVGTLACFITCMGVFFLSRLFMQGRVPLETALATAGLTSMLEVLPIKIDDNLIVAPIACLAMFFMLKYEVF